MYSPIQITLQLFSVKVTKAIPNRTSLKKQVQLLGYMYEERVVLSILTPIFLSVKYKEQGIYPIHLILCYVSMILYYVLEEIRDPPSCPVSGIIPVYVIESG